MQRSNATQERGLLLANLKHAVKALLEEATLKRCVYYDAASTRTVVRSVVAILLNGLLYTHKRFLFLFAATQQRCLFDVMQLIEPLCPPATEEDFASARIASGTDTERVALLIRALMKRKFLGECLRLLDHPRVVSAIEARYEPWALVRHSADFDIFVGLLDGVRVVDFSRLPAEQLLGAATGDFSAQELINRQRFHRYGSDASKVENGNSGRSFSGTSSVSNSQQHKQEQQQQQQQKKQQRESMHEARSYGQLSSPSSTSLLDTYLHSRATQLLFAKNNACMHLVVGRAETCVRGYLSLHKLAERAVLRFTPYALIGNDGEPSTATATESASVATTMMMARDEFDPRRVVEVAIDDIWHIHYSSESVHAGRKGTGSECAGPDSHSYRRVYGDVSDDSSDGTIDGHEDHTGDHDDDDDDDNGSSEGNGGSSCRRRQQRRGRTSEEELVSVMLADGGRWPDLYLLNGGASQLVAAIGETTQVTCVRDIMTNMFIIGKQHEQGEDGQQGAQQLKKEKMAMLAGEVAIDIQQQIQQQPLDVVPYQSDSPFFTRIAPRGHVSAMPEAHAEPSRSSSTTSTSSSYIFSASASSPMEQEPAAAPPQSLADRLRGRRGEASDSSKSLIENIKRDKFLLWHNHTKRVVSQRLALRMIEEAGETVSSPSPMQRMLGDCRVSKRHRCGLTREIWEGLFDADGCCRDEMEARLYVYAGGCESSLRAVVWKFFLGLYAFGSRTDERRALDVSRASSYAGMKASARAEVLARCPATRDELSLGQGVRIAAESGGQRRSRVKKTKEKEGGEDEVAEQEDETGNVSDDEGFGEQLRRIEKDVQRTDRTQRTFAGDGGTANTDRLRNVITIYVHENLEFGYVQGMCDYLAPLLAVMDNEVDVFWAFVALMRRMKGNFDRDQVAISQQLSMMRTLLMALDAPLEAHLASVNASHMYFCYRWFLLLFKREFDYAGVFRVWEAIWSGCGGPQFHVYIAYAILDIYRDVILDNRMSFEHILKFFNEIAEETKGEVVLERARQAFSLARFTLRDDPRHKRNEMLMTATAPSEHVKRKE